MVAPEASALSSDGKVSYLWSCDCCGQSLVTLFGAKWRARPRKGAEDRPGASGIGKVERNREIDDLEQDGREQAAVTQNWP
jgi:hypothetical protein